MCEELIDGTVLLDGTLMVSVKLTVEQYKWLKSMRDERAGDDVSDVIQRLVDNHKDDFENDLNPSRHRIIKSFESWMQRCDWAEAKETLEKLQLLYQQAEIKNKLIGMDRKRG